MTGGLVCDWNLLGIALFSSLLYLLSLKEAVLVQELLAFPSPIPYVYKFVMSRLCVQCSQCWSITDYSAAHMVCEINE